MWIKHCIKPAEDLWTLIKAQISGVRSVQTSQDEEPISGTVDGLHSSPLPRVSQSTEIGSPHNGAQHPTPEGIRRLCGRRFTAPGTHISGLGRINSAQHRT